MSIVEQIKQSATASAASPIAGPAGPPRVLVVDDSVDAAELLALVLQRKGCVVESAHTGSGAIAAFEHSRPDVVLLDLGLPDIDGVTVARQLRELDSDALLVALSGFAEDSERTGADLFALHLLKPIDLGVLDDILARVRRRA